jgi:hypothetical protein
MNTLQTVGLSVLVSGVVVGIFELIIKLAVKNSFEKDLQKHSSKLSHDSQMAIVQLTNELERQAESQKIKLAELFQRQADAIEVIHNRLLHLIGASHKYDIVRPVTTGSPNADQQAARDFFYKTLEDFRTDFIKYVIYLPNETRLKIEMLISTIINKDIYFTSVEKTIGIAHADNAAVQQFEKGILEIKAKFPALLDTLRDDMQNILGIPQKPNIMPPQCL